ncbi:hypothetical protein GOARA_015_00090 [Gordonia araii NBRC 100433]|uniref:Uncharacterized protein n=1 Tax=Gordonia araii NBRC 100433 TaxID=1073574 RepID=G7GYJ6_9ACTN|nr:hypothetical protein [Gordonia araii]NNG97469.1 hypothetical protein [Gordonia araii NBRC 100433]GAB08671.1 hypothetical protein GOARA_015_00090 [Gordonia araii NBRC 100433]
MAPLTVLIAPSGSAQSVYSALADLSAADLVDDFLWVSDPSAREPLSTVLLVSGGRARDVALADLVASRRTTVLRLCSIVPALPGHRRLSVGDETGVAEQLIGTTGASAVTRIRALLVSAPAVAGSSAELAVPGWHNIAISPEDARGPDYGRVPLSSEAGTDDLGRHAAPVIAGLAGLWRGLDHAPLDTLPVVPGQSVRLARSFYRKLRTDEVEGVLSESLLNNDGVLPLPSDQRSQVVYVADVATATSTMADVFWRKHAAVLRGPRQSYSANPPEEIGAMAVLKMFFNFVWASIKNAPAAWYRSVVDSVSSRIAVGVEQAAFQGQPAAYQVVVNGRTSTGQMARWADIGAASSALSGALFDPSGQLADADSDLSQVWQDYARAALTLADAGARSRDLPPIQVGSSRAIVKHASEVVPGPSAAFTSIPGAVAATVECQSIDATDVLGIIDLSNRLTELESSPDHGGSARSTLTALRGWRQNSGRSFGVAAAQRLGEAFHGAYNEVQQLLHQVNTAVAPPPDPDQRNKSLGRAVQATVVSLLLLTGLFVYLTVKDFVVWWVALIVVVSALLVGLGLCLWGFIQSQRLIFALLHQRRAAVDRLEVDRHNLRAALRDLRRLSQAYGQFLSWNRALGAYLEAPLGSPAASQAGSLPLSWGLPMSTGLGAARPNHPDVDEAVGYLRRDLFRPGWLTPSWDNLIVTSIPPRIGSREAGAEASPVWLDHGQGTGSSLDRWSTDLFRGVIGSTGADQVWDHALRSLGGPLGELVPRLVGTVAVAGGAAQPLDEFLAGIDRDAPPSGSFDHALLTDTAVTTGAASVHVDVRHRVRTGLGVVCVATQLSEAIVLDYLRTEAAGPGPDRSAFEAPPTPVSPHPGADSPRPTGEPVQPNRFQAPEMGQG